MRVRATCDFWGAAFGSGVVFLSGDAAKAAVATPSTLQNKNLRIVRQNKVGVMTAQVFDWRRARLCRRPDLHDGQREAELEFVIEVNFDMMNAVAFELH